MEKRKFAFYIVPTPIGNINDITLRAIEILKDVDIIACEDTRTTQKLLNHYEINTKCISYHKYNERERVDYFLNEIRSGKRIALVSDAGCPMICDPGSILVEELRKENIEITALPGASAITTFLSQVPRGGEEFTFIGFIPRSEKQIEDVATKFAHINMVFYDSPERIIKTLTTIKNVRPNAKVALGRELSKLFEEVVTGNISEIIEKFKDSIKGEIVCMLYADEDSKNTEIESKIRVLQDKGFKAKEISTILSTLYNLNKNDIYKQILSM